MLKVTSHIATDDAITGTLVSRSAGGPERFETFKIPRDAVKGELTESAIAAVLTVGRDALEPLTDEQWAAMPPVPNLPGFVADFYGTEAFQALLAQRDADTTGVIEMRLLALQFAMAQGAMGGFSPDLIQDAITRLVAVIEINEEGGQEINDLMARHNLVGVFTVLPGQP